ncbi:PhzF family phenazine biosynthesis protein [Rhizobium sp. Root274]|uniref:PhzF family phenazine biosynthesis protein n=1 Tax=unclassified Rhizobium TaxID=2613769 RepID=UPI0007161D9E|nr:MULTISPECIES: PhzF family phenazine biosynthesis protein [unclassified Rhizobium]KQW29285.1 PhzF family phenazine biosynthesis protein [Rhizobium sp. Root1240]KRD29481.1 PhzF family phenazine biosynthesis protein [Rhizobium sp. Root274]
MRSLAFVTVDVFTDIRFAGNPLAVITDGRGLEDAQMQAIAAEFGYSETSFILPPRDPANTAEVRIFTPVTEVPFAGHPNVGTAHVVATLGKLFGREVGDHLRFEEKAGLVDISVRRAPDGSVAGTTIRAPRPLTIGATITSEAIAATLGLRPDEIETARHAPVFASVGLKFILVEVTGLEALARAASRLEPLAAVRAAHLAENCDCATFLYTWVGADHVRARMFAPFDNVVEDPATGSASAALGAFLTTLSAPADHRRLRIEQGVEMGRRSLIDLDIISVNGLFDHVTITGASVEVMRGTLTV